MLELGRNKINKINIAADEFDFCFAMGWRISPNGDIGCECCRSNSCTYGNIETDDINKMMETNNFYVFTMPNYCNDNRIFNYFEGKKFRVMPISVEEAEYTALTKLSQGEPL